MATVQGKHHDYHLVDPSPWPVVGSISAFIMAVGAITWMHHMLSAAPIIFGVGTVGVIYTMASWWGDVIKEAQYKGDHTRVVQLHHRYGMILFIASGVMFFVDWFWAYFNAATFPADAVHATPDSEVPLVLEPPVEDTPKGETVGDTAAVPGLALGEEDVIAHRTLGAAEEWDQAHPGQRRGVGAAREIADGRDYVGRGRQGSRLRSWRRGAGSSHRERNVHDLLVGERTLVDEAVGTTHVTVVAREDDHGVVPAIDVVERGEDDAQLDVAQLVQPEVVVERSAPAPLVPAPRG